MFPRSPITQKAVDILKEGKHGDTISEDEMRSKLAIDVAPQTKGRSYVSRAVNTVIREHRVVWEWQRKERHWLCLDDHEKLQKAGQTQKQTNRKSLRALQISICVDEDRLDKEEKRMYRTIQLQSQVAHTMTSHGAQKKILSNGLDKLAAPDLPKLLDLMANK